MYNAVLDNEKQVLMYKVDLLTDLLEEVNEQYTETERELKERTKVQTLLVAYTVCGSSYLMNKQGPREGLPASTFFFSNYLKTFCTALKTHLFLL